MNWNGTRVFVTGADGFIGSHLAEALVEAGAEVTAMAFYNSFDSCGWLDESELRDHMRIVRGDIRDQNPMNQFLEDQEIVFHLAALISVPHSYQASTSYIQTNVQGTANVLTAAKDARCIIVTSTSEVYGTAQFTPITEDHPICPQSPYAASKVGADAVARAFHLSYGMPVTILRPFNTYGPRQSEKAFVPAMIRQALDPKCKEIRTGDLEPKRDLNYVGDTVQAFLAIAGLEGFHVLNAGTGKSVSMGTVVERITRKAENKPLVHDKTRDRPEDSEVMDLVGGSAALQVQTGWEPKMTLNEGLDKTITWWRKRLSRMRPGAGYIV